MLASAVARTAAHAVLDYLSPPTCVSCHAAGRWLCRACAFSLGERPALSCPGCGAPAEHGLTCEVCRALGSPLDQLVSVVAYERPVLHKLLWTFKESGNREVLPYLTQRLQTVATEHVQLAPEVRATAGTAQAAVVPVPALRRRVRERGFNQAELLAGAVARGLKLPLRSDVLARVRSSSSQKTLNVHDRRTALKGAFAVATTGAVGISPLPRHVILVDDIATTLATLETCAGVLKRAGVRSVVGVVLAHAQR